METTNDIMENVMNEEVIDAAEVIMEAEKTGKGLAVAGMLGLGAVLVGGLGVIVYKKVLKPAILKRKRRKELEDFIDDSDEVDALERYEDDDED